MDDFATVDAKASDIIDQSYSADTGSGIRTGEQYLEGLRDDREVWTKGKRVADVTTEPRTTREGQRKRKVVTSATASMKRG